MRVRSPIDEVLDVPQRWLRLWLRLWLRSLPLCLAIVTSLGACASSRPAEDEAATSRAAAAIVGDGLREPREQCDDGNVASGDGCSSAGQVEAGYLCHVPGRACSTATGCGNNTLDSGEACDDGNAVADGNGCSADCNFTACGNGVVDDQAYPSFSQETCDDGNRFDGDGCSSLCGVEPGFGCTGSPSRCAAMGVTLYSTGVDARGRRLASGNDPHWFSSATTAGAALAARVVADWPRDLPNARFMASTGTTTCIYQDFLVAPTLDASKLRVRFATFNDNAFAAVRVNGAGVPAVVVSQPAGQPWQKNILREIGPAAFRVGQNRIELCNENASAPPNSMRYLFVDATGDRCGDGVVSEREQCDDGAVADGDGCSSNCLLEPGYSCGGRPSACAKTCGDGIVNGGEECDDGNGAAQDGCSAHCRVEPGFACPSAGQSCVTTCGNGRLDPGEQCDDGNAYPQDGCSSACRIDPGFACWGAPSSCVARCGNGRLDPGEACDDGNRRAGDGCSAACALELGYACATAGQACARTCGNGKRDPGEGCDDGNLAALDGCGSDCRVESGYACSSPAAGASLCNATCGNGALQSSETCDDGNVAPGDGCSPGCRVETGFSCSGAPSVCITLCADGIPAESERCDDGNRSPGDGCSPACLPEVGWVCPDAVVCLKTCGNGSIDRGESCDDGNTVSNDGCSGNCSIERGYECSDAPSLCLVRCGDGVVSVGEVCDDGNLTNGDTCSNRCRRGAGQPCTSSAECDVACHPVTHVCVDDATPPEPPRILAPTTGAVSTTAPPVSGTSEPAATVELFLDDVSSGTATATNEGNFAFTLAAALARGVHKLHATATDPAGNMSAPSTPITFSIAQCMKDDDCVRDSRCELSRHVCVTGDGGAPDAALEEPATSSPTGTDGCSCSVPAGRARGMANPSIVAVALGGFLLRRRSRGLRTARGRAPTRD